MLNKSRLREWAKAIRKLPAYAHTGEEIGRHLSTHPVFLQAKSVLAYAAMPDETNPLPLLLRVGSDKRWYLPRMCRQTRTLSFHRYRLGDSLERDISTGIRQPLPDAEPVEISGGSNPHETLILTPGLVFDVQGARLGYGMGYYDRTLPGLNGVRVGVTSKSLVLAHLPVEPWDIQMHWLATEAGLFETGDQS